MQNLAKDEAGNIWEVDAQGEPVRLAKPAPSPGGRVFSLPQSPKEARQEARQEAADARAAAAADRASGADIRSASAAERTNANMGVTNAMKLAGDYNSDPAVKAYRVAIGQFGQALNTGDGPQADLALTYAFAKAMDPDSVVRESEQGMVTGSQPWFQALVEKTKKQFGMDGAGNFTPEARDALRQQIANSVAQRQRIYDTRREYYDKQARQFGVDPEIIIGQHDSFPFAGDIDEFSKRVAQTAAEPAAAEQGAGQPLDVTVTDTGPSEEPYADSYLSQGLSGTNTGISNTLGAPVDLTTAALNLVPKGLNAIANTDIPTIRDPIAGSQWWQDLMSKYGIITPPTDDPSKQFLRRVGESVGSSIIPAAKPAQLGGALLAGLGGGIGAATAQQVAPGNPLAEFGGELLGGGVAGLGAMKIAQRGAQREIESAIPTVDQLKQQAGEMYRSAEARGVAASPDQTQGLSEILRQTLADEGVVSPTGRLSEVYPKAREAVQLADDYANATMSPTQLQTVRKVITDTGSSPDAAERRLGSILTDTFDEWAAPIAPELPAAREVSSRYLNAQKLEQARELAGARAGQFSGSGFENALRTEYRGLDRGVIKGRNRYGPAINEAIENVSRGTPGSNFARAVGRFAPSGPVSAAATMGVPAAIGTATLGGPIGLGLGASAGIVSGVGRRAASSMGIRNAEIAELIARNGGPIEQAPLLSPAFEKLAAQIAALQQAKYLTERPQQ